jgi:hypothetical protein
MQMVIQLGKVAQRVPIPSARPGPTGNSDHARSPGNPPITSPRAPDSHVFSRGGPPGVRGDGELSSVPGPSLWSMPWARDPGESARPRINSCRSATCFLLICSRQSKGKIDAFADADSRGPHEAESVHLQGVDEMELQLQLLILLERKRFGEIVVGGRKILTTNEVGSYRCPWLAKSRNKRRTVSRCR